MVFGGDGIFLARPTGAGHVWLQTLPLPKLARALLRYLPQPQSDSEDGGFVSSIPRQHLSVPHPRGPLPPVVAAPVGTPQRLIDA